MIEQAVKTLREGGVIGLPTETVYGLAADATNADAVAKIFALKGRPATNPLIVHVESVAVARRYAATWPQPADELAARYWPGPLTIVTKKTDAIPAIVTANGSTVALRVPAHPLARRVLQAFGGPLAASSANRSNHISPTAARHVREEFGDAVPIVLDGGPCEVGIESTVVEVTDEGWRILRPGRITVEQIRNAASVWANEIPAHAVGPLRSPGQLPVHYAPRTPAYRFEPHQRPAIDLTDAALLDLTLDPATYARNLYARLRLLDTQDLRAIFIELPPDRPEWQAVRDRLLRATRPLPEKP